MWRSSLTDRLVSRRRSRPTGLSTTTKVALAVVVLLVLVAILGPLIAPHDPTQNNVGPIGEAPSWRFPLGTDQFGRDVLSRLIAGTRVSVAIGIGATLIALIIGSVLGAIAATSRKWVDESIMRALDVVMAFPAIIVAACVAAVVRPGAVTTGLVISTIYIPHLARVVYANVLEQYGEDYVAAARVMGSGRWRILLRHVAMNCAVPVLVFTATIVADVIVLEASLSFIGLGIQPPTASWGNVVADGKELMFSGGWWVSLFGGLAVFGAVLALNLLAEGLSDAMTAPKVSDEDEDQQPVSERGWTRDEDQLLSGSERGSLLQVDRLTIRFPQSYGEVPLVSDVSFDVAPGQIVGLVGESGCGKSLTGLAIMGLLADGAEVEGQVRFRGHDLLTMKPAQRRALLGTEIAMIYQDALSSLNPGMTVGQQLRQVCRRGATRSPEELLELVGLSATSVLRAFPHQLSGGQRQRVLIALALSREPSLLLADEPTTALDETIQAQVVDLLRSLQAELGFSVVLVSHDLALVADLADRIMVMYAGQLVEAGPARQVVGGPRHPYSAGLLGAIRSLEANAEQLTQIPGTVPSPLGFPSGCRFADRCPNEVPACRKAAPAMLRTADEQFLACYEPVEARVLDEVTR